MANPELARLHVEYEVRRGNDLLNSSLPEGHGKRDLIVVGGTSQKEEPILGSTSERFLRKALVPVMVAKKPLDAEAKIVK